MVTTKMINIFDPSLVLTSSIQKSFESLTNIERGLKIDLVKNQTQNHNS